MTHFFCFGILCRHKGEKMLEIITPSGKVGWLNWDFLAKSLEIGDNFILKTIDNMIGFYILDDKHYYYGDLNDELNLQYYHCGAYETLILPPQSVVFYSKQELLNMLCEQYEKATSKSILSIFETKQKTDKRTKK